VTSDQGDRGLTHPTIGMDGVGGNVGVGTDAAQT